MRNVVVLLVAIFASACATHREVDRPGRSGARTDAADAKLVLGRLEATGGRLDPLILAASNGEFFLLHGMDGATGSRAHASIGAPVAVRGRFAWHGRVRLIDVIDVIPADLAALEEARGAEPEYEMTRYFMTIIKTGRPDTEFSAEEKAKLFEGHFAHASRQAAAGRLVLAGPFGNPPAVEKGEEPRVYRGIYLYRAESIEEVERWNQEDPTIRTGYFATDVVPWHGPKSLGF